METKPELHFMVDLETTDVSPSTHILSLAIVMFDPFTRREPNKLFTRHHKFGLTDQKGGTVSCSTLEWWMKTNPAYFQELCAEPPEHAPTLADTLSDISSWFEDIRDSDKKVRVWCTGTFDVDILNNAFRRLFGITTPLVRYHEVRDVRVMRQVMSDFGLEEQEWPASHNAYDDCLRQIDYVRTVYKALQHERRTESAGDTGGRDDLPPSEDKHDAAGSR